MSEEDLAGWRQGGWENRGAADPQFSVPAISRSIQYPVMLDPAGYGGVPETFIRSFVSDKRVYACKYECGNWKKER